MAGAGFILPRSSGKEAAKMNFSKPVNPIRNYAFRSVITALILLSPVIAFLMAIAAEMLIDLLMVQGTSAVALSPRAVSDWFCPAGSGDVLR